MVGDDAPAPEVTTPYSFHTAANLLALRQQVFWPSTDPSSGVGQFAGGRLFPDNSSIQANGPGNNSNSDEPAAKLQRMVVLKQGDGPVMSKCGFCLLS